jgi:hypothetical protein
MEVMMHGSSLLVVIRGWHRACTGVPASTALPGVQRRASSPTDAVCTYVQLLPRRRQQRLDERGLAQARVSHHQHLDELLAPDLVRPGAPGAKQVLTRLPAVEVLL